MNEQGFMRQFFGSSSEIVLVLFMMGVLLVLFTPIPSGLLDFLLLVNISFGLLILLLTFFMDKPLKFSTFPSLLLLATLFRLSLNIAATRLILSDGDAGKVIAAVGNYVVGGNYVIGMVVFFILIVVQYVVITNGAQRVAEVAARFTLDSMPGKQMSIDADLNMGLIDEHEAQSRRKNIEKEANFYGSMDGASKFVKGDAIAGILIILIDIIGGLTVGIAQRGMSWPDALETYTLLTVGDGIVTQIPALVISTATGIIVTRAATDAQLSEEITNQVAQYPKSLVILAIALAGLMLLPGIPALPVLLILSFVLLGAFYAYRQNNAKDQGEADEELLNELVDDQDLYEQINVEPIELTIGQALVPSLGEQDGLFMEKIKAFRKQYAMEMGFVFPSVRLKEQGRLEENHYRISVYDATVANGEVFPDKMLAISASLRTEKLEGIETEDPSYGLPSVWINQSQAALAKSSGYTVVDPVTVMFTHFSEVLRRHAPELLTRVETDQVVKRVKEKQPSVYEELIPNIMSMSEVQKVLQQLLAEKVSIRNIALILETLVDHGKRVKSPEELAECVRQSLGRAICEKLTSDSGELKVLTFDPAIEHILQSGLRVDEGNVTLLVEPKTSEQIMSELGKHCESMMLENLYPVLICSATLRRHVKKLLDRVLPHLSVVALNEIPTSVNISSYAVVRVDHKIIDRDRLSRVKEQPEVARSPAKANAEPPFNIPGAPANV
jgi:flagellar biosynthesis protein FlhA